MYSELLKGAFMAITPEGKVKRKADAWIKANLPGAWVYKPPGGLYGSNGVGDYILVYNYTPVMIEAKPDNREPTALQKKNLKDFKEAGGVSCILRGFEEHKLNLIKCICDNRAKVLLENEVK